MNVLSVRGLCKRYGSFALRDVSFDVAPGSITGFIGRNGAGKTTTLKSLLDFVHPDAGEALFFGRPLSADEFGVKQAVGFASGGFGFYPLKRLRTVTDVTRRVGEELLVQTGVFREFHNLFDGVQEVQPLGFRDDRFLFRGVLSFDAWSHLRNVFCFFSLNHDAKMRHIYAKSWQWMKENEIK